MEHYWPIREDDKCKSIKFAVDWGNIHEQKVPWLVAHSKLTEGISGIIKHLWKIYYHLKYEIFIMRLAITISHYTIKSRHRSIL